MPTLKKLRRQLQRKVKRIKRRCKICPICECRIDPVIIAQDGQVFFYRKGIRKTRIEVTGYKINGLVCCEQIKKGSYVIAEDFCFDKVKKYKLSPFEGPLVANYRWSYIILPDGKKINFREVVKATKMEVMHLYAREICNELQSKEQ